MPQGIHGEALNSNEYLGRLYKITLFAKILLMGIVRVVSLMIWVCEEYYQNLYIFHKYSAADCYNNVYSHTCCCLTSFTLILWLI